MAAVKKEEMTWSLDDLLLNNHEEFAFHLENLSEKMAMSILEKLKVKQ